MIVCVCVCVCCRFDWRVHGWAFSSGAAGERARRAAAASGAGAAHHQQPSARARTRETTDTTGTRAAVTTTRRHERRGGVTRATYVTWCILWCICDVLCVWSRIFREQILSHSSVMSSSCLSVNYWTWNIHFKYFISLFVMNRNLLWHDFQTQNLLESIINLISYVFIFNIVYLSISIKQHRGDDSQNPDDHVLLVLSGCFLAITDWPIRIKSCSNAK